MDWNIFLKLPSSTLAGDRPIPKTRLIQRGKLTKLEEKKLKNLKSLTFYASLGKSNTHISSVRDDSYEIGAVLVLRCILRSQNQPKGLVSLLHKIFPNPTILLLESLDDRIGISVSLKRKSLAERGAIVVEKVQETPLFSLKDSEFEPLLERLSFTSLPQTDLLTLVNAMLDRVTLANTVPVLGFYPLCPDVSSGLLIDLVESLQEIRLEMMELQKHRRNKEITLAESSKIRIELNDKEKQCDSIVKEIWSLCNERNY